MGYASEAIRANHEIATAAARQDRRALNHVSAAAAAAANHAINSSPKCADHGRSPFRSPTVPYQDLASFDIVGVDKACKELYLSASDFTRVLGMSLVDFQGLPLETQQALKRQHNLL